jgi:hypothetical protein
LRGGDALCGIDRREWFRLPKQLCVDPICAHAHLQPASAGKNRRHHVVR